MSGHLPMPSVAGHRLADRFLRLAVLYLLAGVLLGAWMGITHQHLDKQIHVHGNLLGWASGAVFALLHRAWPAWGGSRWAVAHFWLHTLGVPLLLAGLALAVRGIGAAEPLLGIGTVLLVASAAVLAVSVWAMTGEPHGR